MASVLEGVNFVRLAQLLMRSLFKVFIAVSTKSREAQQEIKMKSRLVQIGRGGMGRIERIGRMRGVEGRWRAAHRGTSGWTLATWRIGEGGSDGCCRCGMGLGS